VHDVIDNVNTELSENVGPITLTMIPKAMQRYLVASNRPLPPSSPTPLTSPTAGHSPKGKLANLLGCLAENGTLGHSNITIIKMTCFMEF